MNVEEIKALIQLFEASSLSELSIKRDGTQLVLKRDSGRTPSGGTVVDVQTSNATDAQVVSETAPPAAPASGGHTVASPLVGTFYRRPSPDEPPYVEPGHPVKVGDTLCVVEAMKVMNEIKADVGGVVRDILVEDANIVEYGQPLLVIDPS